MAKGQSSRSHQRRTALRFLFEMDINRTSLKEVTAAKREVGEDAPGEFAYQLITGVTEHRPAIDEVIQSYAECWEIDSMPRVDRSVLRMAIFELFFTDIPPGATIDEAVELAKSFSTEDSGKFVNGLLGRVNRDREAGTLSLPSS